MTARIGSCRPKIDIPPLVLPPRAPDLAATPVQDVIPKISKETYEKIAKMYYELNILEHSLQHTLHVDGDLRKIETEINSELQSELLKIKPNLDKQALLWKAAQHTNQFLWEQDIDMALQNGADINLSDSKGNTLINSCCTNLSKLKFLISRGANPLQQDGHGNNALFKIGSIPAYQFLKDYLGLLKMDLLELRNRNGDTLLTQFIKTKHPTPTAKEIEFFLSEGFLLESKIYSPTGYESILHYIARIGSHDILVLLLSLNCKPTLNSKGQTPIDIALENNNWILLAPLIRNKVPLSIQNLNHICRSFPSDGTLNKDQEGNLALEILRNANFNNCIWTRIHFAARHNFWNVLMNPEKPNALSNDSERLTPLHLAANNGHLVSVFFLLNAKANPTLKNAGGHPPRSTSEVINQYLDFFNSESPPERRRKDMLELTNILMSRFKEDEKELEIIKNILELP